MYRLEDVAAILDVHIVTVRRWVTSGLLPAKKIGRLWLVYGGDLLSTDFDRKTE